MTHEELQELCGAYALGALDGEELSALTAHLPGCWACRRWVMEFEEISAEKARALTPLDPRPEARARLMARISGGAHPATEATEATEAIEQRPAPRARPPAPLLLPLVLAAAVAVALGAALWAQSREAQARRDVDDLVRRLAKEQQLRVGLRDALASAQRDLAVAAAGLELLGEPAARVLTLAGQEPAPGASGRVVWRGRDVVVTARGLPPLPPNEAYELWVLTAGAPIPAGVYRADPQGRLQGSLELAVAPPDDARGFALSREPAGGVPAPTGPLYLVSP